MKNLWLFGLAAATAIGCTCGAPPVDPTTVELGATSVVAVLNPAVNDLNSAAIPGPGAVRSGVTVSIGGQDSVTGEPGIGVLTHLDAGAATLEVGPGTLPLTLVDQDLRELAVALDGGAPQLMADVRYAFGSQQVVEIDAGMTAAEVATALNGSDRIVLIRGGTYTGDIDFNGSNVTLFGEGASGGRVTLVGNVTVNGSNNRIRGAIITGNLSVDGAGFALTFSKVGGALYATGSDAVLLENTVCGSATLPGSNLTVLGNQGLSPIPLPDGGC